MKSHGKTRERLFTVFFMFAVTFVFISAVSGLHLATQDIVARNALLYMRRAILAAGGLDGVASADDVTALYGRVVTPVPDASSPAYYSVRNPESDRVAAFVFARQGPGLWGTIKLVAGLNPELDALVGVSFVEQNETPGLGARIAEQWFRRQFIGKHGPLRLTPEGTASPDPREIDAITGATVTSSAVRDILNRLLNEAPGIVEKT